MGTRRQWHLPKQPREDQSEETAEWAAGPGPGGKAYQAHGRAGAKALG